MLVLSKLTVQPIRYLIPLIKQVPKVKSLVFKFMGLKKRFLGFGEKRGWGSAYVDMVVLKTINSCERLGFSENFVLLGLLIF